MKKTYLSLVLSFFSLISYAQWSQIAQPDITFAKLGKVVSFNPTLNDIDSTGKPIIIDTAFSNDHEVLHYNDSIITFRMLDYSINRTSIHYKVIDTAAELNFGTYIRVYPDIKIDTINANDIKASIFPGSLQFFDVYLNNFLNPTPSKNQYFYPANAKTKPIFNYSLWLGGINENTDSLHLAAERYRQNGTDFWPGPLSIDGNATTDSVNAGKWMRSWKVSSDEYSQRKKRTQFNYFL